MRRWLPISIVAIAAAATVAAVAVAGSENTRVELAIAPVPYIESGTSGFAVAKFFNDGPSTVTQGRLELDFIPALSMSVALDAGCSGPVAVTRADGVGVSRISCDLGRIPPSTIKRSIRWTPSVATTTELKVESRVFYDEAQRERDAANPDTSYDEAFTTVLPPAAPNVDTVCTSGQVVASTTNEPDSQTTHLTYDGQLLLDPLPCGWGVVGEQAKPAGLACGAVACSTDVWFTSLPQLATPASLTLTLLELPKGKSLSKFALTEYPNWPSITDAAIVPACVNGAIPAGPGHSCEVSRAKYGSRGAQFTLLVQGTGRDPGYAG